MLGFRQKNLIMKVLERRLRLVLTRAAQGRLKRAEQKRLCLVRVMVPGPGPVSSQRNKERWHNAGMVFSNFDID